MPVCSRVKQIPPPVGDTSYVEVHILSYVARLAGPTALLRKLAELRPRAPEWTTRGAPGLSTTFDGQPDSPTSGCHTVSRNGTLQHIVRPPEAILAVLDTAINAAAVEALQANYLLIHAGAVAHANQGVLLPAPSGRGKTTLVAGLVAAGFEYLSDEVGVLEPETLQLLPFAKCLGVKQGALTTLAPLFPELAARVPRLRSGQETIHYLTPPSGAWPAGPVRLRFLIAPRYVAGARTELVPMTRTSALSRLVEQVSVSPPDAGAGLLHLIQAVRALDCYTLTMGNLQEGVDELQRLVAGARPPVLR